MATQPKPVRFSLEAALRLLCPAICRDCGAALNALGVCPRIQPSGSRVIDLLRKMCGHGELRHAKAGAA